MGSLDVDGEKIQVLNLEALVSPRAESAHGAANAEVRA
jgi:hypothetical protein